MKNWTIKEAVNVIVAGNDQAAIAELAKHFPMFTVAVAKNDMLSLVNAMGEKFTVRRLDFGATENDDDEGETEAEATEAAPAGDVDVNSMSTKELMKLCEARGIKVPHYGKNKQFYLDALAGGASAKAEEAEDDADAETEADPYAGKSAMELYKECKKRGLKPEAKKPSKYYIEMLKKADAAAEPAEDGEDDWDEEEATPAPKAEPKKSAKKPAGKSGKSETKKQPAAEEAATEDDDDDWNI